MNLKPLRLLYLFVLSCLGACAQTPAAAKITPQGADFFETKIRPVLAKSCYPCHSSANKATMGGLSLETRESVLKGGTSGPALVPGDISKSALMKAIRYEGRKMPPSAQLPESVIADFEKWVQMGAPDPRDSVSSSWKPAVVDIEKGRKYWAFQPPVKPAVPAVKNVKWSANPIDRLILANLEKKQLTPVADADRATWLRRVTFDLTGLPPTVEELNNYLKDMSKDADAKQVDRLLASERFGERWGRHWLDVARYAESVGRGRNYPFPFAWRYRDYVIDSFNHDKPFDQFIKEQIAGDLLPAADAKQHNEQMIGTAFLSLGSHDLLENNPAVFRMDVVDEQVHATTRAFLATTVGCARCHDHKFDPIPTTDYYAMAGIFKSTEMLSGLQRRPRDNFSYFNMDLLAKLSYGPGEQAPEHLKTPEERQKWEELNTQLKELLAVGRKGAKKQPLLVGNKLRETTRPILNEIDKFPLPMDLAMGVRDGKQIADCEVHIRGEVKDLGPKIPRGFVQVENLPGEKIEIPEGQSGRLQLAQWIARKENPITARVAVNRLWEHLFGRGIVPTVDNFGKMGEQPSNQALLDYLAVRFVEQGWSTKKLIREIVLTRAYHLSSANNAGNANKDPDNVALWRMNRQRLEVEAIRDTLLQVGGKLDLQRPEASPVLGYKRGADIGRLQAKGMKRGQGPGDIAFDMNKRTVYVPIVRNQLSPMFEVFDFPEPSETKGRRDITTVPTQALFLMNSPFVMQQAKSAATRLLDLMMKSDDARIQRVYMETLGRAASAAEVKKTQEYVQSQAGVEPLVVWGRVYQAMFESAEFRYRS